MKCSLKWIAKGIVFKPKVTIVDTATIVRSIRKLGKNHEDLLMSQKISELPTTREAESFKKDFGLDIVNESDVLLTRSAEKDIDFVLPKKDYAESYYKYPHGNLIPSNNCDWMAYILLEALEADHFYSDRSLKEYYSKKV